MSRDALIGFTGFVGDTLTRQHEFSARFNRSNIAEVSSEAFGTIVCAAAPGSMFKANRFPDQDAAEMQALMDSLAPIRTKRFILISSIAVLNAFDGGDDESSVKFQTALAYGRHRRELEAFCARTFEKCMIVRLPALFGTGLKKNFLFDLLNPMPSMVTEARFEELREGMPIALRDGLGSIYGLDSTTGLRVINRGALESTGRRSVYDEAITALGMSSVQFTHPESRFQYYDMTRLWSDIGLVLEAGIDLIHLAPEPLEAAAIHEALLHRAMPVSQAKVHREDLRTRHAPLWGRSGPYIAGSDEVMDGLRRFFARETAGT